jgi:endonuclease-8
MEGPSLFLAQEQLVDFKGKKVKIVSGNTKIGKERLLAKDVKDIFAWGKHLCFQFDDCAMRVHFLLFGTFEAVIDGNSVTGDYKRVREPRLQLVFSNGEISMFNCSIKIFETTDLKSSYDFAIDIMSHQWNSTKAFESIRKQSDEEIDDILLSQDIFAGVGNIIKNEVLSLVKIHPQAKVASLSDDKIKEIITTTREFSYQFYLWRKEFVLRKNLLIYHKASCPHCGRKIIRERTGKTERWSYYCPYCQPLTSEV